MKESEKNKRVDENLKNGNRRSFMKKAFYNAPKLIVLGPLLAKPENVRGEDLGSPPPDPGNTSTWSQRE